MKGNLLRNDAHVSIWVDNHSIHCWEKVKKEKEMGSQQERKRLGVMDVMKPLQKVKIEPIRLKKEFEQACESIGGVIVTVLTFSRWSMRTSM